MSLILVPTDFSDGANNAFLYAIDLAKQMGAEIELYHAFDVPSRAGMFISLEQYIEEEVSENFSACLAKNKSAIGHVAVKTHAQHAGPVAGVVSRANHVEADFIVMGTKGEHSIPEKIFGSVSSGVIRDAAVPVLVVPEGYTYKPVTDMAYATDLELSDDKAFDAVQKFALQVGAKLHHISVNTEAKELSINNIFEQSGGDNSFSMVNSPSVTEGIFAFVEDRHIDLLAMYKPERGFWERLTHNSVTTDVLYQTPVPVLIVHNR